MNTRIGFYSLGRCGRLAAMACVILALFAGAAFSDKGFSNDEVIIIGRNFVVTTPDDTGVILESKKGKFEPARFEGLEGTAAMLFLYNRVTRNMCVDLLVRTYKVDPVLAAEKVDKVLMFYRDNRLIYKSRFVEKPADKIGIQKFRV